MTTDSLIPDNLKDPKYREYFTHLQEIIEKQNRDFLHRNIAFQILNKNYRQDLKLLLSELLDIFQNDQFSSIRFVIKNQKYKLEDLVIKAGIGKNCEMYEYLDDQVEDQLGKPGILYISDTAKIHSIKFVSGSQFPKTILGISLGNGNDNLGMIWFACENQKIFTKFESDSLVSLIDSCASVIDRCIEWNNNLINLSFRNEILDLVKFPIFIVSENEIIFSNISAQQVFNNLLEDKPKTEELIGKIWNIKIENDNLFALYDRDYQVELTDSIQEFREPNRAAILMDETLPQKQREYVSLVIDSISQWLRSPLNLILGSIKMIPLVGEVNDHQKDYINNIRQKAEISLNIIDELLDLERIIKNSGLKIQTISINKIIDMVNTLISHYAKQKRISIINKTSDADDLINVDKVLFSQALANIFEFAIKQTRLDGEISFIAEKDVERWHFTINDSGNGFSQVEVDRLNSNENPLEVPSNLLLVRRIIELHKGTFEIQSVIGKGNIYIIEFPTGLSAL